MANCKVAGLNPARGHLPFSSSKLAIISRNMVLLLQCAYSVPVRILFKSICGRFHLMVTFVISFFNYGPLQKEELYEKTVIFDVLTNLLLTIISNEHIPLVLQPDPIDY